MNETLLEQAIRESRLKKIIAEIKKEYSLKNSKGENNGK